MNNNSQAVKAARVSISLPFWIKDAAERYAKKTTAGNVSAVVQDALLRHLRSVGAIGPDPAIAIHAAVEDLMSKGVSADQILQRLNAGEQ